MNKVIIFPTDTVYGIGTNIYDKEGIDLIYDIKHRPKDKPLAVLCANISQIKELCYVDSRAELLINKYLPGPLTLILKTKEDVAKKLGYNTLGVRIPNLALAIKILEENGPMFVTSVNDSGKPSLDDYETINNIYKDKVFKIYPKTNISSHLPSSVVDLTKYDIIILREGAISLAQIKETIGENICK